jgi:hypothetical protein
MPDQEWGHTSTWKHVYRTSQTGSEYQGGAGSYEQVGADWGNGTKPIVLWHLDHEWVVFKVPAGKYFRNINDRQASSPGCFVVCKLVDKSGLKPDVIRCEELFQMPVSAQGQKHWGSKSA